jgi:3-isopropylmalate/(R)-2-methylmalate dehydratase small subunit
MDYGFTAVVSPRFGDIFRNNATKNGLVPVQVSEATSERLREALHDDPGLEVVVDVERRVLEVPALGLSEAFPLDDATQERFLEGLDDIGITLRSEAAITTYEQGRPSWMPSVGVRAARAQRGIAASAGGASPQGERGAQRRL